MDLYRTENLPYHITVKHRIDLNVVQLVVCYAFDLVQDVIITKYYVNSVQYADFHHSQLPYRGRFLCLEDWGTVAAGNMTLFSYIIYYVESQLLRKFQLKKIFS